MKTDMKRQLAVLILPMLFLVAHYSYAQQGNPEPHWASLNGPQYLESSAGKVHIKQREQNDGSAEVFATAALNLAEAQSWKISFDIRFGQMQDAAASFRLMSGSTYIGWVGADGFTKSMGAFVGKDNEVYAVSNDLEWHQVSYISDGSKLKIWLDGRNIGEGPATNAPDNLVLTDKQDMNVACHQTGVWVRNVTAQSEGVSQPAAPIVNTNARMPCIPVRDDEQTICCLPGDTLRIAGHYKSANGLQKAFLDTGNNWEQERVVTGMSDDYSYDWKAPKEGIYQLNASYLLDSNRTIGVRHLTVNVLSSSPLTVDMPQSAVTDTTVSVTPDSQIPFHPDAIAYFFNGQRTDAVEGQSLTIRLPVSKISAGTYQFYYEAVNQKLGRFVSRASVITIPERVRLTLASTVQITTPDDKIPFNVSLAPGVSVAKVVYSFDGKQIGVSDHTPYTANVSLTPFKSGTYDVQATATDQSGNTIASPAISISLTNQPDDKVRALAVQAAAEQKAREEQRLAQIAQQEAERPAREAAARQIERDNAAVAIKSHTVTFSISGDLWKIGGEYYVDIMMTNRSLSVIRLMPPDLVLDDYSSEGLFPINPAEKDGVEIVTPAQSTVTHKFKSLGLPASKIGKPLKIRINALLNGNVVYAFVPLNP